MNPESIFERSLEANSLAIYKKDKILQENIFILGKFWLGNLISQLQNWKK